MKILVTGGAGYIGSIMTKRLLERGDEVVVVDSLERGHRETVDPKAKLMIGNLLDKAFVSLAFQESRFDAVIHFSGYISMGESMENPYLESKLMVEKLMSWYQKTHGLNSVALRYFNASGASLDGKLGENHNPESHIIPNIMKAILAGESFKLFGTDYKTKDGTCVRDYIHVIDLVGAHVLAIDKLMKDKGMFSYNVGTGNGYSNREVIEMAKRISGKDFQVEESARRPGDADTLIADASKIKEELGFNPKYSDLETIVETAWEWHSRATKK